MTWKILIKIFVAWCVRMRTLLNCVTGLRNSKHCSFWYAYPGETRQKSSPDGLCYLLHFDTESVCPFWLFSPRHVFSGRHFGALCQQTRFIVPVESVGTDRVLIVPEDSGSHRHRDVVALSCCGLCCLIIQLYKMAENKMDPVVHLMFLCIL